MHEMPENLALLCINYATITTLTFWPEIQLMNPGGDDYHLIRWHLCLKLSRWGVSLMILPTCWKSCHQIRAYLFPLQCPVCTDDEVLLTSRNIPFQHQSITSVKDGCREETGRDFTNDSSYEDMEQFWQCPMSLTSIMTWRDFQPGDPRIRPLNSPAEGN